MPEVGEILVCIFCTHTFKYGYPCRCNQELELNLRQVQALELIAECLNALQEKIPA